jgi:hypothetical protein
MEHCITSNDFSLLKGVTHGPTKGNGGVGFFKGVLQYCYHGKFNNKTKDGLLMRFASWSLTVENCFCVIKSSYSTKKSAIETSLNILAGQLDNIFSGLVIGRVVQLVATCIEFNPNFVTTINAIDTRRDISATEKYLKINSLLPKEKRFSICPKPRLTHSFITFDEASLIKLFDLSPDYIDNKGSVHQLLFGNSFGVNCKITTMCLSTHSTAQNALTKFDCHFDDSPLFGTKGTR